MEQQKKSRILFVSAGCAAAIALTVLVGHYASEERQVAQQVLDSEARPAQAEPAASASIEKPDESTSSASDVAREHLDAQYASQPVAARETAAALEAQLVSGALTSPEMIARAIDQAVWCRSQFIVDPPFTGKEAWWDRAQQHCAGVSGSALPQEVQAAIDERRGSLQATRDALHSEEETAGQDRAIEQAKQILVTSTDPAALWSAARYLGRNERSLSSRVTGTVVHPGESMNLEALGLKLFACTINHDCGPSSYETISYCLRSQVPCPEGATLDVALRETQAAYTWQRIWAVSSFFLAPPPRSLPN